jgi:uncharacterized protein YndB with AHSA1/START domain
MTNSMLGAGDDRYTATLVARRLIRAAPERLFAAWTEPKQLIQWWGPEGVVCTDAEVDLRVGGAYRIANRLPDGSILWIAGIFEIVDPPRRLRFSWRLESQQTDSETVIVGFEPRGTSTEVTVTHERIASAAARESHERGWIGCLAGLDRYAALSG